MYKPNQAAPAPTTILINPDCSIVGSGRFIYHMTHLYRRIIYVVMKILGNILQLSTARAICIIVTYGLGPRSFTDVSTSSSTVTFLDAVLPSAGVTNLLPMPTKANRGGRTSSNDFEKVVVNYSTWSISPTTAADESPPSVTGLALRELPLPSRPGVPNKTVTL